MGVSNSYFQFKQFRISQGNCAMKVTTDACIQGAWTPVNIQAQRILDIGAGTGLLALMMAQKNATAIIDGIELDTDAANQALENVAESLWAERVNILEGDIKDHVFNHQYDLIISNPPFFNNSLLSDNQAKNNARHTTSLSYEDLFKSIDKNLNKNGMASILLPVPESGTWEQLVAEQGWYVTGRLLVRHRATAIPKRIITLISRQQTSVTEETLTIQNEDGSYTTEFAQLMTPWYLNL